MTGDFDRVPVIQQCVRSLEELPDLAGRLGIRRPLLVGSKRLLPRLTGFEQAPVFTGYHPNPDWTDCLLAAEMYRSGNCDGLISIGGGSAMDTAKAVKALVLSGSPEDALDARLQAERLPHIAIPGTAGTGAEATRFAVLYVKGKKISLSHPALRPDAVVLDASLLATLPDYHRKACAMDALCQGIESLWARGATEESRIHALRAARGVPACISSYLTGDPTGAERMLTAAWESGLAIDTSRTTAAHAMSYMITKMLGPAHGHACILTLPHLWRRLGQETPWRELDFLSPEEGGDALEGLIQALGLEIPGLPAPDVLDALTDSVNPERLGNHPQTLSREELRAVYIQALTPPSEEKRARCLAAWSRWEERMNGHDPQ